MRRPDVIDLKEIHAREYLESKKTTMTKIKQHLIKYIAIAGIFYYLVAVIFWWVILPTKAEARSENEIQSFLHKFPKERMVIGCYNNNWEIREARSCTQAWDHNIILPERSQIERWLTIYDNPAQIVNRLAIVNFESAFREHVGNPHAYWYVQTLRRWNIAPEIEPQLTWMRNREEVYRQEYFHWQSGRVRGCGYYWNHPNHRDGYEAGEYGVMACLYRYHYHAHNGTWYAKRGIEVTKFYKWYIWGVK